MNSKANTLAVFTIAFVALVVCSGFASAAIPTPGCMVYDLKKNYEGINSNITIVNNYQWSGTCVIQFYDMANNMVATYDVSQIPPLIVYHVPLKDIYQLSSPYLGYAKLTCDVLIDCGKVDNFPTPVCTDLDGDGYKIEGGECGLVDCNDNNAAVNPGATEACGNGIDDNCNTQTDEGCCEQITGNSAVDNACCVINNEYTDPLTGGNTHGDYVSCVALKVVELRAAGAIDKNQGGMIVREAAKSDVNMPFFNPSMYIDIMIAIILAGVLYLVVLSRRELKECHRALTRKK
ncbi:MAG: putative metal-binding motif-containing protein [Candidatus Pacearchaeota archaeon]